MDELGTRARQELEPAWDEVREARVLSRTLAEADQSKFRWSRVAGSIAALAAAAVVVVVVARFASTPQPKPPVARAAPALPSAVARMGSSMLSFADGSKAHLRPGAELEPLEQTPHIVSVLQRRGEVRYEVEPDAARPFTVQARDVEIRVMGTVFTVTVESEGVAVSVEQGRVAVRSGERRVELSPGETLRLTTGGAAGVARPVDVPRPVDPRAGARSETAEAGSTASAVAPPVELLAAADAARARGDLATAERLLGRLIAEHPRAPQAASATFSLGRIQSARGNFAAAARTFQALRRQAPAGPLAEDALAEAANASALAGQNAVARALADQYLGQYPQGAHAQRMRRLGTQ